jgi:DNA-binding NarL/FixJ family response regulator
LAENLVNKSPIRVLIVDDYEPWRRYYATTLSKQQGLEIIGEALNGLEAVQRAQELQPDLILLDIGLPILNGIEAARRIREVSPASKIVFVSENRSVDVADEALSTGACGYVVKSDAATELLSAVEAVLQGKQYLSVGLAGPDSSALTNDQAPAMRHSHEVAFYANDNSVVDGYARLIDSSLKGGKAVIVVVTESHRASLLSKLEADGVDVLAAIKQGRYIPLDADDILSRLTDNDVRDSDRCTKLVRDLIMEAAKGVGGDHARVVVCGEIAPTLLSKGNTEGAIKLERLWDEITRGYGVHMLCGYLSSAFLYHEADPVFQRICAEHSAVHGRVNWPLETST